MHRGQDIAVRFPGFYLVHHNLPGKKVQWHEWPQHSLFVPLQGEVRIELRSSLLVGGPGKMIYVPPKTPLDFKSSEAAGERLICLIDTSKWQAATSLRSGPTLCPAHQLCKEILFYLLLNPRSKFVKSLVSTFLQVLAESIDSAQHTPLLEVVHLESKVRDRRLGKVLEIFRHDYATAIRVTEVAKQVGVSERSLNRLFSQELGMSPKQVLTHYRITSAKELLQKGSSVTNAAWTTGYRSLAQFIAAFRQLTGQLPSEFARLGPKQ